MNSRLQDLEQQLLELVLNDPTAVASSEWFLLRGILSESSYSSALHVLRPATDGEIARKQEAKEREKAPATDAAQNLIEQIRAHHYAAHLEKAAQDLRVGLPVSRVATSLAKECPGFLDSQRDAGANDSVTQAILRISEIFTIKQKDGCDHGIEGLTRAGAPEIPIGLTLVTGDQALVSAFGIHLLALHVENHGLLYFSGKNTADDIYFHLLTHMAQFSLDHLVKGEIPSNAWERLTKAAVRLSGTPVDIEAGFDRQEIEMFIRHRIQVGVAGTAPTFGWGRPCAAVVIDAQQLPWIDSKPYFDDFEWFTEHWASLAAELRIPIVLLGRFPGMKGSRIPDILPPTHTRHFKSVLSMDFNNWPDDSQCEISFLKHPTARFAAAKVTFDAASLQFNAVDSH